MSVTVVLGACSSSKDDAAAPTTKRSTTLTSVATSKAPDGVRVPGSSALSSPVSLPASVVERTENAYDYETVPTTARLPLPTVTVAPPAKSPAEIAATSPPSTAKIGAVDNDAAAASPDTRIPTRITLPTPTATASLAPPPDRTVPDLGLDPGRAEAVMTAVRWPAGLEPLPNESPDMTGNAVANTYASDRTVRAAMRSAAGRVLQQGDRSAVIAGLVIVDRGRIGANPLSAVRRSISSGTFANDLVSGVPALSVRDPNSSSLILIAIDGERLAGVAGLAGQESLMRQALAAMLGR